MAHNSITDGPSMWQLMLAMFDENPSTGGSRQIDLTLKCGVHFNFSVNGIFQPDRQTTDDEGWRYWTLIGNSTGLPDGYYYSQHNALTLRYDPYSRKGYVDLKLMCPACGATIWHPVNRDDAILQVCNTCGAEVMQMSADTGSKWHHMGSEAIRQHKAYGHSLEVRFLTDGDEHRNWCTTHEAVRDGDSGLCKNFNQDQASCEFVESSE